MSKFIDKLKEGTYAVSYTHLDVYKRQIMKKAIVKPYVDFNKLEGLFVVVPKEEINIGE